MGEHIFTINYDFCLKHLNLGYCLLIVSKVVFVAFEFRYWVGLRYIEKVMQNKGNINILFALSSRKYPSNMHATS